MKSHGGTDSVGFASALDMAIDMAKAGVMAKIAADHDAFTAASVAPAAIGGVAGA